MSAALGGGLPLLVVVGVDFEARGLRRRLGLPRAGTEPAGTTLVVRTVGLRASQLARLTAEVGTLRPGAVLATGLAGGCAPEVAPGDLVVGEEVGPDPGGRWWGADPRLRARALRAIRSATLPHHIGRLALVSEVQATVEAKGRLWEREKALAVDMESAHVLGWASGVGLPALAVRAVADGPGDALPRALVAALGPDGRLRGGRVVSWIGRPHRLAEAWRLWRRSMLALDRLARFLAAFTRLPDEP